VIPLIADYLDIYTSCGFVLQRKTFQDGTIIVAATTIGDQSVFPAAIGV